jgi:hypothetical protein
MDDDGDETVEVFARVIVERINAHPLEKHENVTEQDRERMPHEEIHEPFAGRTAPILVGGHDRVRTDVGAAQFGIMVVVMVVRTAPHAARAQRENAKDAHQTFGELRTRQNRVVLLVVIDDEEPHEDQSGEHAATKPRGEGQTGERSGECDDQQSERGENRPPTLDRIVFGEGLGRQDEFGALKRSLLAGWGGDHDQS